MASIIKRSGKWTVRYSYYDNEGNRHFRSKGGFRTKSAAKIFAIDQEKDKQDGNLMMKSDISLADYFWEWYKTYKEPTIAIRTKKHYEGTHRTISKVPAFTSKPMAELTRTEYQQFLTDYGKNHAKETIQKINTQVRACVKNALYDEVITKDFTDQTTIVYNKDNLRKVDYLNVTELKQMINYLTKDLNYHFTSKYMILTACYTGMRPGEIQGLEWRDINFNFKTISIKRAWSDVEKDFTPTKNEASVRIIRASQDILDILKHLKEQAKPESNTEQVFIGQFSIVPTTAAVNHVLRKTLQDLKIKRKGFNFQSVRHTHVAFLLSQKVDLYAISKRLGHSNMTTTSQHYSYLIEEYKAQTDDQIDIILQGLMSKKEAPHGAQII